MEMIADLFNQITSSPLPVVIAVAAIILGYYLEWTPHFPNALVNWVMILVCVVAYVFLADLKSLPPGQRNPTLLLCLYGLVLGGFACLVRSQVLKRFGLKLPEKNSSGQQAGGDNQPNNQDKEKQ